MQYPPAFHPAWLKHILCVKTSLWYSFTRDIDFWLLLEVWGGTTSSILTASYRLAASSTLQVLKLLVRGAAISCKVVVSMRMVVTTHREIGVRIAFKVGRARRITKI